MSSSMHSRPSLLGKQVKLPAKCPACSDPLSIYGLEEPFLLDENGQPLCQRCAERDPLYKQARDEWQKTVPRDII
jgi:hypothetical protein